LPTPTVLTTATAFCYNTKHPDVLEPCTKQVAATSIWKGNAALAIANPFKILTHYVKKLSVYAKRDEAKEGKTLEPFASPNLLS
jgi:hypothetical protein